MQQPRILTVRPCFVNRFHIGIDRTDGTALLEASGEDLKKLDQVTADVEVSGMAVPVLLKRYLMLNAKIIGFNRDPRFNDALDDRLNLPGLIDFSQNDREFVAAHSGHGIDFPDGLLDSFGGFDQKFIAHAVAIGVIDLFKTVQVHIQDAKFMVVSFGMGQAIQ